MSLNIAACLVGSMIYRMIYALILKTHVIPIECLKLMTALIVAAAMVAADFSIRPLCTIVPTSLGMGIVVDTGGFVMNNATQLDIAVAW